jgi:hypothetical protein
MVCVEIPSSADWKLKNDAEWDAYKKASVFALAILVW